MGYKDLTTNKQEAERLAKRSIIEHGSTMNSNCMTQFNESDFYWQNEEYCSEIDTDYINFGNAERYIFMGKDEMVKEAVHLAKRQTQMDSADYFSQIETRRQFNLFPQNCRSSVSSYTATNIPASLKAKTQAANDVIFNFANIL